MSKNGFLRKALVIVGLTIAWLHFFLSDGHFIQSGNLRWIAQITVVAIAAWGVLTLLSHRMGRHD